MHLDRKATKLYECRVHDALAGGSKVQEMGWEWGKENSLLLWKKMPPKVAALLVAGRKTTGCF